MIALAISALLGLYLFIPDFLFDRFGYRYVQLKKTQRKAPEDIFAGFVAAVLPFAFAWILLTNSWYAGHYPFFVDEPVASKYADYRTLFSAFISDSYFHDHQTEFWVSLRHIFRHQVRFLCWFY